MSPVCSDAKQMDLSETQNIPKEYAGANFTYSSSCLRVFDIISNQDTSTPHLQRRNHSNGLLHLANYQSTTKNPSCRRKKSLSPSNDVLL